MAGSINFQYIYYQNYCMKTFYLGAFFVIGLFTTVFSQTCLPNGITLQRQSQVDSFKVLYPNCTEIEGDLILEGVDETELMNLDSLNNLVKVNGDLQLKDNARLERLKGLENINEIGGTLVIFNSSNLINVLGLERLKKIDGSLSVSNNSRLTTFAGFDNLLTIGKNLSIRNNNFLIDLSNLQNLNTINGELTIWGNNILSSISGLDNVEPTSISRLEIRENPELTECSVNTVCNFIENNTNYAIGSNAFGCSAAENILVECNRVMPNVTTWQNNISVSPNPAQQFLNIDGLLLNETYQIINCLGKIVLHGEIEHTNTINLNTLQKGIYILNLFNNDDLVARHKFSKM